MAIDLKPQLKIQRKVEEEGSLIWRPVLYIDPIQIDYPVTQLTYTLSKQGGCRGMSLTMDRDPGIEYGDLVQLQLNGEGIYGGIINKIPKQGTQTAYNFEAYGLSDQLRWKLIEEFVVENETLENAVSRLHRDYIVSSTDIRETHMAGLFDIPSMIGDWDTIIEHMVFEWKYPQEILEILRDMGGAMEFGVDWDRYLYFRMKNTQYPADEIAVRTWTVGKEGVGGFQPVEDSDSIANKIYLNCGTLSEGSNYIREYEDLDSTENPAFGIREQKVTLADAFPVYKTTNICQGLLLSVNNLDSATGLDLATDDNPETCFDSGEAQAGGPIWYSKMGSAAEIETPEVGETGMDIVGNVTFGTPPGGAKFGNAIRPGSGYLLFSPESNGVSMEAGTLSCWWYTPHASAGYPMADGEILLNLFEVSDNGRANGLRMMIGENYNGAVSVFLVVLENNQPTHRWVTDPITFSAGWHHLQFAWDSSGEVLANKINGEQTKLGAVTWFDGVIIQRLTKTWSGWGVGGTQTALYNIIGWIDDFQVYDYPMGDADGREVEGGGELQQITCDLKGAGKGRGYNIGRIVINSEAEDDGDHGAAGILVETQMANGTWIEVYRNDDNSENNLDLHINPSIPIYAIRISIIGSDDNYFRIYSLEAYEFAFSDVDQYAATWLSNNAYPKESATLVIIGEQDVVEPRGRARIFATTGEEYEYEISEITHNLSGNQLSLKLGDIPDSIPEVLNRINRKILEVEYQAETNTSSVSSGEGMQANSIGPSEVDHLLANQITAGTLKSQNYVSGVAGFAMALNEAKIWVYEENGLQINSGGGIEVSGTGSNIRGGQTAYDTGTGFWMGQDSDDNYKFSVGEKDVYGMRVDDTGATFLGSITAVSGEIGGWTISATALTGTNAILKSGGVLSLGTGSDAYEQANRIYIDGPNNKMSIGTTFKVENGVLTATSGTIGGWTLDTDKITSAASGARIELDETLMRISIYESSGDSKVAMGYLNGLPKHTITGYATAGGASTLTDSTQDWTVNELAGATILITAGTGVGETFEIASNTATIITIDGAWVAEPDATTVYAISDWDDWDSNDYGFWARSGDNLVIDGDVTYHSGDWLVENDGSIKIYNADAEEILRLGSDTGDKGLFLYKDIAAVQTLMAKYTGTGLTIKSGGDITVESGGDIILKGGYSDWNIDTEEHLSTTFLCIYPETSASSNLHLGFNRDTTKTSKYVNILSTDGTYLWIWNTSSSNWDSVRLIEGYLEPYPHNTISLGSSGIRFRNLLLSGEGQFGGGYGSTGVTISVAGDIEANGALTIDGASTLTGEVKVGGGYGSTGCTIEADGDIKTDGTISAAGVIQADGYIYIGEEDTTRGRLFIYGDGSSSTDGGNIVLNTAADYDTTINSYQIQSYEDDLYIGPSTDINALILAADGQFSCTSGAIAANGGFIDGTYAGVDGTFEDNNGNTVTVSGGIIINLTT